MCERKEHVFAFRGAMQIFVLRSELRKVLPTGKWDSQLFKSFEDPQGSTERAGLESWFSSNFTRDLNAGDDFTLFDFLLYTARVIAHF